jgi:hypothetical protein
MVGALLAAGLGELKTEATEMDRKLMTSSVLYKARVLNQLFLNLTSFLSDLSQSVVEDRHVFAPRIIMGHY